MNENATEKKDWQDTASVFEYRMSDAQSRLALVRGALHNIINVNPRNPEASVIYGAIDVLDDAVEYLNGEHDEEYSASAE